MATLNGTIFKVDGTPPSAWTQVPRGCPLPGPIPVARPGDICPRWAKSHIYFRPLQTPFVDAADASALIVTSDLKAEINDETGAFSATLQAGNYCCTVGADEFEINIPADAGVFLLQNVITSPMNFMPTASNASQGTYPATAADFVLPANAVAAPGNPVATGWTQQVVGPGKFIVTAVVSIEATSRNGGAAQDDEVYTAYIQDTTNNVMIGLQVSVETIFTGATGQLLLTGTITIAGATNVLLEIYAAGNPNATDPTPAPSSVGTIIMEQSSISIARLP